MQLLLYKWLFSMVVYFTNGLSFSISRILISRMAARDHICEVFRDFMLHKSRHV